MIALEHPDRWGGLVDLPVEPGTDEATELIDAITGAGVEDQVALLGGDVLVPRLVPHPIRSGPAMAVRPEAAYLVTGGLGGLGLELARWLADLGARCIVLTGRSGLPPRPDWDRAVEDRLVEQIAAVRALEDRGVRVEVVAVDVADRAAMTSLVARFATDLPALAGIVHAAAQLGNERVEDMSAPSLEAMMRSKVDGTWLLHELTVDCPLDFFVLFSSTTSLLGSKLLGHYAAANQFLDAFAHHRHGLGLPVVTVNWGTWDVMRVASGQDRAVVAGAGLLAMATVDALDVLADVIAVPDLVQITVASVDWSLLKAVYEARRPRPLLAELGVVAISDLPGTGSSPALVDCLAGCGPDEQVEAITEFLRGEVAMALEIAQPLSIDVDQGLFEMGMDSLMSVELKGRIEVAVGEHLPSTLTFNFPTISALTGFLMARFGDQGAIGTPDSAPAASANRDPGPGTVDAGDDLSEDELAAMLLARLNART